MGPGTGIGVMGHPSHSCSDIFVTNWKGVSPKVSGGDITAMVLTCARDENFQIMGPSKKVCSERQQAPLRFVLVDAAE
jgi:hypothetical protein